MNYSFLKDVIGSPWQIEPQTLNGLYPIFKAMINGLHIEKGKEPQNHLSYGILADARARVLPGSGSASKATLSPGAAFSTVTEEPNDSSMPGDTNVKVINILPIRGILTKHDQDCGPMGTRTLGSRLLKADSDSNVIGHVMIVESGGGQVIAVPELTDVMVKCTKPIVVWVDGIAASAAYYIACYAKEIIASRNQDIIGCIGTMIIWEGRKSKSAENKAGDIQVTIYADGAEEKNIEYEQAINEFNFKPAKEKILNPLNARFKSDVLSQRPAVLKAQLTGRTYFASEVMS